MMLERLRKRAQTAPRRRAGVFKRFRRDETGAVAIEFGAIAIPFFTIFMAILETSLVYFAETNLTAGVSHAARMVRTGQIQNADPDQFRAKFVEAVCDKAPMVPNCESTLKVDVRVFNSFAASGGVDSIEMCRDGADPDAFDVEPGGASSVVLARACFDWELFTPLIGEVFSYPAGSGKRVLSAVQAFRNEPF